MQRLSVLFILVLLTVACNQKDVVSFDENSTVVIEKQNSSETADYEVINELEEKKTMQEVIDLLHDAIWDKNVEVDMDRDPDYKLDATYHIWITPLGDTLEIIDTRNGNYTKLSESDSSDLYELITNAELEGY